MRKLLHLYHPVVSPMSLRSMVSVGHKPPNGALKRKVSKIKKKQSAITIGVDLVGILGGRMARAEGGLVDRVR